jgi:hypothetical protein
MAEEFAGSGAAPDREGFVAGAVAVADRDAAVPSVRRRAVGDSNTLPTRKTARVLVSVYRGHLVALHGFIKKTRATPDDDLVLARKRQKELER